jgi:hypothetical protein
VLAGSSGFSSGSIRKKLSINTFIFHHWLFHDFQQKFTFQNCRENSNKTRTVSTEITSQNESEIMKDRQKNIKKFSENAFHKFH